MPAQRIPVDASRLPLVLAMSPVRPALARVELSDGSTRPDPNGTQAMDKITGLPQYLLDCVIPSEDEGGRMTTINLKIASATRPSVTPGTPIRLIDAAVLAYVDQQSGRAALSWSCTGVEPATTSARTSDRAA